MQAHESDRRKREHRRRETEHRRAQDLGEADVPLRQTVMQEVAGLHDEKGEVGVRRSQHPGSVRPKMWRGSSAPRVGRVGEAASSAPGRRFSGKHETAGSPSLTANISAKEDDDQNHYSSSLAVVSPIAAIDKEGGRPHEESTGARQPSTSKPISGDGSSSPFGAFTAPPKHRCLAACA